MRSSGGTILLSALLLAACGTDPEYAVLIDAYPSGEATLSAGSDVLVVVRDLGSGVRVESQRIELGQQIGAERPMKIAIELDGPGERMVHLEILGASGDHAATRCYDVRGVERSEVVLTPLAEMDADRDRWPTVDDCREPDGAPCQDACPDVAAIDCDDNDPARNPGAEDLCDDGVDQDCDGEEPACTDHDGDGVAPCGAGEAGDCDCDDADPTVHPGALEDDALCENGRDEDCDGADARCDRDGDGYLHCPGGVANGCDCDDRDPEVNPGASETPGGVCDGLDNNCNLFFDEVEACLAVDLDGDGSPASCALLVDPPPDCEADCNDCSAAMTPGRREVCGDEIDESCALGGGPDGRRLSSAEDACDPDDGDEDGIVAVTAGGSDCDDGDPRIYPGAPDRCGDRIDGNCSGGDTSCDSDQDGDRFNGENDCDDQDDAIHPGAVDGCDGVDDDCDGIIDEDVPEGRGCVNMKGWKEIDLGAELQHCGACRHDCNQGCDGQLCRADDCVGGECRCGPDEACVGEETCCLGGCSDLVSDADNCGSCGARCPAATCEVPSCDRGSCAVAPAPDGVACAADRVCCGGECTGACAPGEVEEAACGNCGIHSRTCRADCQWGSFGGCQGEGVCAPGDIDAQACGNCGSRSRTCTATCGWGAFSACAGEGVCTPGSANRQLVCGECGNQEQHCSASCQWSNVGSCDNNPARTCDDLDGCTTDTCGATGNCSYSQCSGGGLCCHDSCTSCCDLDASSCSGNPPGQCKVWSCSAGNACVAVNASDGTDPYHECTGRQNTDCCNGTGGCRRNAGGESCN